MDLRAGTRSILPALVSRAMRSDLLGRLAMGSTHKTIYVPDLQMLRIPLPPLAEQHAIVESIRESNSVIDAAVDAIDLQLALLAERARCAHYRRCNRTDRWDGRGRGCMSWGYAEPAFDGRVEEELLSGGGSGRRVRLVLGLGLILGRFFGSLGPRSRSGGSGLLGCTGIRRRRNGSLRSGWRLRLMRAGFWMCCGKACGIGVSRLIWLTFGLGIRSPLMRWLSIGLMY